METTLPGTCKSELDLSSLKQCNVFDDFLGIWRRATTDWEVNALLDHLPHMQLCVSSMSTIQGATQYHLSDKVTLWQKLLFLLDMVTPRVERDTDLSVWRLQLQAWRSIGVILNNAERFETVAAHTETEHISPVIRALESWSSTCPIEASQRGVNALFSLSQRLYFYMMRIDWDLASKHQSYWRWQSKEPLLEFVSHRQRLADFLLRRHVHNVFADAAYVLRPTVEAVAKYLMSASPGLPEGSPTDPWEFATSSELLQGLQTRPRLQAYDTENHGARDALISDAALPALLCRLVPMAQANEAVAAARATMPRE